MSVADALARARRASGLGAFWALDEDGALDAASEPDRDGSPGPLAGMPVAVKDLLDVKRLPTTAGLAGEHAPVRADAEIVRRLRRAGAVPIGKTAMDPLGCTTGGQAPGFPPCLNPLDRELSPGGSSAGSAVAVAAGIVPVAIGSDTAGSVRIPAAYCGIVGFKPALRSLPRRGAVRIMPSFDTPGILAASISELVQAYDALASRGAPSWPRGRRLRVAAIVDLVNESEPAVAAACERAAAQLAESGVALERLDLRWRPEGLGLVLACELAETWGTRVEHEPVRFTQVIRDTVEYGRRSSDADRRRVLEEFALARRSLRGRLEGIDAVLCPTVPVPAPARDAESVRVSTRFTRIFNALDWPALSVPAGSDHAGRPIGVQVAAPPCRLQAVFELGRLLEGGGTGTEVSTSLRSR